MLKAALLYADKVKLCSPAVNIVAGVMQATVLPTDELLLIYSNATGDSRINNFLETKRSLLKKKHRTRQEILAVKQIEHLYNQMAETSRGYFEKLADDTKIEQIVKLVELGLVEVEPIEWVGNEEAVQQYFNAVAGAVLSGKTYPLLDDTTGDLVRQAIKERKIVLPSDAHGSRAQNASLVAQLFESLPLFDAASIDEIIDIRKELDRYLVRFRSAIMEYSAQIKGLPWEAGFETELQDLYDRLIRPALMNLEETFSSANAVSDFLKNVSTTPTVLSGVMGALIGLNTGFPALLGLSAGITATVVQTFVERKEQVRAAEQNGLYFYYSTTKRLSKNK